VLVGFNAIIESCQMIGVGVPSGRENRGCVGCKEVAFRCGDLQAPWRRKRPFRFSMCDIARECAVVRSSEGRFRHRDNTSQAPSSSEAGYLQAYCQAEWSLVAYAILSSIVVVMARLRFVHSLGTISMEIQSVRQVVPRMRGCVAAACLVGERPAGTRTGHPLDCV
jgi:hypothetical protein